MTAARYVIAVGSNRPGRHGPPVREAAAAIEAVGGVIRASRIMTTAPLGPSIRRFANAAILIENDETPPALLARLKGIERDFGRRRGARWGARVIDLDIILWSQGPWSSPGLTVPHPAFRQRRFVLDCAVRIVPGWRDPVSGLTMRQLAWRARARHPARLDRAHPHP